MREATSAAELEAIEVAVRGYFESWFDGDVARMQRCLHPRLAKRRPPRGGESDLYEVSYNDMIEDVSGGPKPEFDRRLTVTVLDVAGDIATAMVNGGRARAGNCPRLDPGCARGVPWAPRRWFSDGAYSGRGARPRLSRNLWTSAGRRSVAT